MGKRLKVKYSINEAVKEKIIPGVNSHSALYKLLTIKKEDGKRILNAETTKYGIKAENGGNPWIKISGKIYILGSEVKKFLELNNLL
jgi:hypothetical protein